MASALSGWFFVASAQMLSPVQAVTASEVLSWLFPSPNGEVPLAHECALYASKARRSGNSPLVPVLAMSAATRSMTGCHFVARAGSLPASRPAV